MDDKEKKTLPEQPVDEKPESAPGVSAEPSAHTWVDDMKQEMVQIASAMAGKFVSQSMTEEMQAQLIDETLEEMGDETWQK